MTLDEFQASKYGNTPHCLLIGHPVEHSLSPEMHNTASNYYDLNLTYLALDVSPQDLASLPPVFNGKKFVGANVTIPYKQELRSYVDKTSEAADEIGAINTIYKEDGVLWGCNTDAYGFSVPLQPYQDTLSGERAVIFGTGGASRAVVYALGKLDLEELIMVSRTPERLNEEDWPNPVKLVAYSNWTAYAEDAMLIVNTTPLGMEPNVRQSPVRKGEKHLLEDTICYDIVYKPQTTKFLKLAREAGATTIGGLEMLMFQGSRSYEYWTGNSFPIEEIKKRLDHVL